MSAVYKGLKVYIYIYDVNWLDLDFFYNDVMLLNTKMFNMKKKVCCFAESVKYR